MTGRTMWTKGSAGKNVRWKLITIVTAKNRQFGQASFDKLKPLLKIWKVL